MKAVRLRLSGWEVDYNPKKWTTKKAKWNNNCYAYAVNDLQAYRVHKAQPGNVSGMSNNYHSYSTCKGLAKRVVSDNPGKIFVCPNYKKPCPRGYYKIMLFVSPVKGHNDFHWYKQHGKITYKVKSGDTKASIARFFKIPVSRLAGKKIEPGKDITFKANIWSHKRGWGDGPLLTDANGKAILNPRTASRNYGSLNYKRFCHAFCVSTTGVNVGKTRPEITKKLF
jgi:LysM repeat protein